MAGQAARLNGACMAGGMGLSSSLDKSPMAIRRELYTLKHIESMPFEQSMAFTESQIGLLAMTEDARQGQLAFREKRKPHWTGN